jgi:hypothetical protein
MSQIVPKALVTESVSKHFHIYLILGVCILLSVWDQVMEFFYPSTQRHYRRLILLLILLNCYMFRSYDHHQAENILTYFILIYYAGCDNNLSASDSACSETAAAAAVLREWAGINKETTAREWPESLFTTGPLHHASTNHPIRQGTKRRR